MKRVDNGVVASGATAREVFSSECRGSSPPRWLDCILSFAPGVASASGRGVSQFVLTPWTARALEKRIWRTGKGVLGEVVDLSMPWKGTRHLGGRRYWRKATCDARSFVIIGSVDKHSAAKKICGQIAARAVPASRSGYCAGSRKTQGGRVPGWNTS